jgi:hypothetical protein
MTPEELEPLDPELSRLLDVERPLRAAPAAAKARLYARLASELFPGGGGPSGGEGSHGGAPGGAPPAGAAGGAGWTAAAATKLAVGVGVVSFTVGGLVGAGVQSVRAPVTPPGATAAVAPPAPATPVAPVASPIPAVPGPVVPVPAAPGSAPAEAAAGKGTPPRGADASLQEENSLLETARAALARKDADAALAALGTHAAKFPQGQLVEERSALEVLALATAGRAEEARAKAAAFRQRFPAGLFRGLVDGAAPP